MNEPLAVTPMHLAICVSDFDSAVRFYRDALGYTLRHESEDSGSHSALLGISDYRHREGFMSLGSSVIAIDAYERPEPLPPPVHAFNRLGISQLSFGVPNIDEASRRIVEAGGRVLDDTRVATPQAVMIGFTDPDGTRLQLVQRTG